MLISSDMQDQPGDGSIDIAWLEGQVQALFARNRVARPGRGVYHAPSLQGDVSYSSRLPRWLCQVWKAGGSLKDPWRVRYPHQWFWDSCFHAIVLARLSPELAREEVRSLLRAQREDGFIPHMVWNPRCMHWLDRLLQYLLYPPGPGSPYLHPPVLALSVEEIFQATGDRGFLVEVLPHLQRYYLYIERARQRGEDGLVEIISSYESGKDRSPEYDLVYGRPNTGTVWYGPMTRLNLRYRLLGRDSERIFASQRFRVKDLLFNTLYAQNLAALGRLGAALGHQEGFRQFSQKAQRVEASILGKMYDPESGLFYSLDARHGADRLLKVKTISSLLPLVLDTIPQALVERLVSQYLADPREFWAPYPLPAQPLSSPSPEPLEKRVIWRGPQTWINLNWYLARGLRKQGRRFPERQEEYNNLADELTLKTYELVKKEGFREYYDARTGKGYGAYDFGWSTLALDMVYNIKKGH